MNDWNANNMLGVTLQDDIPLDMDINGIFSFCGEEIGDADFEGNRCWVVLDKNKIEELLMKKIDLIMESYGIDTDKVKVYIE